MIIHRDSLEWLKEQEADSIDHIITDPPYLIDFMNKGWDSEDNVAGSKEYWEQALRVCKAGSYALVFGHSRTHHRVMVAMEDAGWEIRDTIMWLYGEGFPKSRNLGDGWGSCLKPAYEPIILARKPFDGSLQDNWKKNSLGGLNIDACRVRAEDKAKFPVGEYTTDTSVGKIRPTNRTEDPNPEGRFPANIILDEEAGKLLDEQVGRVSRFFYCAKVKSKERNLGCEELEDKPSQLNSGGLGRKISVNKRIEKHGTNTPTAKNTHPTIKPIKLMEYLVKLVSKEGQTILDPFAGSGSTGLACKNLKRNYILVEREDEYIPIIRARVGEKENKDT